jgi:hypothetical protein
MCHLQYEATEGRLPAQNKLVKNENSNFTMATYFEHSRWKNYCISVLSVNGRNHTTQMKVISCRIYSSELEIVMAKLGNTNHFHGNGSTHYGKALTQIHYGNGWLQITVVKKFLKKPHYVERMKMAPELVSGFGLNSHKIWATSSSYLKITDHS